MSYWNKETPTNEPMWKKAKTETLATEEMAQENLEPLQVPPKWPSDAAGRPPMDELFRLCHENEWSQILKYAERIPLIGNYRYIIHQAITSKGSDTAKRAEFISKILKNTPEAAKTKNESGSLPLHIIIQRKGTNFDLSTKERLINEIIDAFPGALTETTGELERTPLHIAFNDPVSASLTKRMIKDGERACFMKDKKGCLPAHVACRRFTSPDKLRMLLTVNPGALFDRNNDGFDLLGLAKKHATKSHPNFALIEELKRQMENAPRDHVNMFHNSVPAVSSEDTSEPIRGLDSNETYPSWQGYEYEPSVYDGNHHKNHRNEGSGQYDPHVVLYQTNVDPQGTNQDPYHHGPKDLASIPFSPSGSATTMNGSQYHYDGGYQNSHIGQHYRSSGNGYHGAPMYGHHEHGAELYHRGESDSRLYMGQGAEDHSESYNPDGSGKPNAKFNGHMKTISVENHHDPFHPEGSPRLADLLPHSINVFDPSINLKHKADCFTEEIPEPISSVQEEAAGSSLLLHYSRQSGQPVDEKEPHDAPVPTRQHPRHSSITTEALHPNQPDRTFGASSAGVSRRGPPPIASYENQAIGDISDPSRKDESNHLWKTVPSRLQSGVPRPGPPPIASYENQAIGEVCDPSRKDESNHLWKTVPSRSQQSGHSYPMQQQYSPNPNSPSQCYASANSVPVPHHELSFGGSGNPGFPAGCSSGIPLTDAYTTGMKRRKDCRPGSSTNAPHIGQQYRYSGNGHRGASMYHEHGAELYHRGESDSRLYMGQSAEDHSESYNPDGSGKPNAKLNGHMKTFSVENHHDPFHLEGSPRLAASVGETFPVTASSTMANPYASFATNTSFAPPRLEMNSTSALISNSDVLCPLDKRNSQHPGNISLMSLIESKKVEYANAVPKKCKTAISHLIYETIRATGRFLLKSGNDLYELSESQAREKISRALRKPVNNTKRVVSCQTNVDPQGTNQDPYHHGPRKDLDPTPFSSSGSAKTMSGSQCQYDYQNSHIGQHYRSSGNGYHGAPIYGHHEHGAEVYNRGESDSRLYMGQSAEDHSESYNPDGSGKPNSKSNGHMKTFSVENHDDTFHPEGSPRFADLSPHSTDYVFDPSNNRKRKVDCFTEEISEPISNVQEEEAGARLLLHYSRQSGQTVDEKEPHDAPVPTRQHPRHSSITSQKPTTEALPPNQPDSTFVASSGVSPLGPSPFANDENQAPGQISAPSGPSKPSNSVGEIEYLKKIIKLQEALNRKDEEIRALQQDNASLKMQLEERNNHEK